MTFKKIAGKIHLWLGFIAGAVLVVNLIPAAIFTFNEELFEAFYHDELFVKEVKANTLPLSVLHKTAQAAAPKGERITGAEAEREAERAYIFYTFKANPKPGISFFSEYAYYSQIYVDQYSGKVLGVIDMRYNWIYLLRVMHQQMLLRYDIGHYFIGGASLILIVSAITGLVLWWPKNKAAFKQRFSIKWNAKWRRKNYDVHNVGGFYTHLFILLIAGTGLIWSFTWWSAGVYRLLGDDLKSMGTRHQKVAVQPAKGQGATVLDKIFADALTKRPSWTEIYIYLGDPEPSEKPADRHLHAYVMYNDGSAWDESDEYEYNFYTAALKGQLVHEKKSTAEKWQQSNYGIHTGSIYGMPSKILICLVTLFCASLPVTGFYIWWGRRKKSKKPGKRKARKSTVSQVEENLVEL